MVYNHPYLLGKDSFLRPIVDFFGITHTSPYRVGVGLFAISFALRAALLVVSYNPALPLERSEVSDVANALATRGELADAYALGSGPTAHVSPLYPILIAPVYRIFGYDSYFPQRIVNSALTSMQIALLPYVSTACGLSLTAGLVGAAAMAVLPLNFSSQATGTFESSLAGLVLLVAFAYSVKAMRAGFHGTGTATLAGLLWGIAILTQPTSLIVMIGLLCLFLLRGGGPFRSQFGSIAIVTAAAAIVLAPWAIRNKMQLGSWIFTRSNFGLELHLSNNDLAQVNLSEGLEPYIWSDEDGRLVSIFRKMHPRSSDRELKRLKELGEVEYHKRNRNEGIEWILSHPQRFLALTAQRIFRFWIPSMTRGWQELGYGVFTIAGLIGLVLIFLSDRRMSLYFLPIIFGFPVVYYVIEASARYRSPIDWAIFLLAGCLGAYLLQRHGQRQAP